jgi:hypothetical protein
MGKVAIFVDYENLTFVLQRREYSRLNHHQVGTDIQQYASQFGDIDKAVMWAEWDRYVSGKRQEQSAQALLTELGFDCLYLLRPSDRSYTEQSIIKKLPNGGSGYERVILISGDYAYPELLGYLKTEVTLVAAQTDQMALPGGGVDLVSFHDIIDQEKALTPLQTPHGLEPAAFYIWMQRVLQEELRRRNWNGMSFHMLARLIVERGLCEEDLEAQFYINQAVREGFLERSETELPTGRRILLKPTIIERSTDPVWSFDEEFRWAQLIWALDLILERNPWWEYVTFSRLREELEKWSLFSGADELQRSVEESVEKGIYTLSIEEGGAPLFRKKYKYTLGQTESLYDKVRDIPKMVAQVVRKLLLENPHWHGVSFSKLLDELGHQSSNEDPNNNAMWLDRQRLKDWCNFLIAINFLHAFRGRSRVIEGELRDPPTLLRLVPEHPWVQQIDAGNAPQASQDNQHEDEDNDESRAFTLRDIDFYRLVVVIEHYLHISNNDAVVAGWMPMSTLFHVMGRSLERAFCNAIVRAAREKGVLEIRTHDPRPGQHPARGAHLDLQHPYVEQARERLMHILEMLQNFQDRSGYADLYALEARLREDEMLGESEEERLAWIDLMREENLILVRPIAPTDGSDGATRYQCTLNFRDRYVLRLLESLFPSTYSAEHDVVEPGDLKV